MTLKECAARIEGAKLDLNPGAFDRIAHQLREGYVPVVHLGTLKHEAERLLEAITDAQGHV